MVIKLKDAYWRKIVNAQKHLMIGFVVLIAPFICKSEESQLINSQPSQADIHSSLSYPSIGEFFSAVDYQIKPSWSQFTQPVIPSNSDSRSVLAFQIGKFLSDSIHGILSKDSQQIKNNIREIELISVKLNIGQAILPRLNSISNFCETKNWNALHEELDAIRSEIQNEMNNGADSDLIALMDFGEWLRAFQIVCEIVLKSDHPEKLRYFSDPGIFDSFNLNKISLTLSNAHEIFIQEAIKYKTMIQKIMANPKIQKKDIEDINNLIKNFMREAERTKTKS